jgi:serine protease Do
MKNLKFGIFFVGLAVAVGGAVAVLRAQDVRVEPRRDRGDVLVLDGRGAQLGIRVSDPSTRQSPRADSDSLRAGVLVDEVNADSPAEKAGIKVGDIIVEFDGERVRSARQFTRLVQETPDGRTVKVAVLRNGQKQTVDATPEAGRAAWDFSFDGDQIRRELERSLRELPRDFDFRFDDRGPRRFEYRRPQSVMPFTGSRGRLGVSVQSLTPDLEEYFGATSGGVLVSSVAPDSAAAKAGMKAGDVITSINGDRVGATGDLMRELDEATGEVTIVVLRDKTEITLTATLGSGQL